MRNTENLFNENTYKKCLNMKHFSDKKLSFSIYKNATVLPYKKIEPAAVGGGVVTNKGEYLENTALHTKNGVGYDVLYKKESSDKIIYLGMFAGVWGHCITDNLRRLWFLKSKYYKENFINYKLVYIAFPGFEFNDNFKTLLDIIGIDCSKFILINEVTEYDEILIPDESFYTLDGSARFFTKEYRSMINEIRQYGLNNQKETSYDKVYFTYSKCSGYKQIGEYKLEHFFRKQGYKIIAPEQFSFKEQLNILVSCKFFASTIGSCSHNIMFMQDGAQVILIPRANYLTGYQLAIDEVSDLNINYIDSSLSLLVDKNCPCNGPFYYYISDKLYNFFEKSTKDSYFSYKDMHDFKRYMELCFMRNDLSDSKSISYYSSVLMKCLQDYKRNSLSYRIKRKTKIIELKCLLINKIFHSK